MLSNIKRQYKLQKALWSIVPARGIYITLWILLAFCNFICLFLISIFILFDGDLYDSVFAAMFFIQFGFVVTYLCTILSNPFQICNNYNPTNIQILPNATKDSCNSIRSVFYAIPVKTADIITFQLYNTLINSVVLVLFTALINICSILSDVKSLGFIGMVTILTTISVLLFHIFVCASALKHRFEKAICCILGLFFAVVFCLYIFNNHDTSISAIINNSFLKAIAGIPGIIISLVVTPALVILTNKIIITKHKSRTAA